MKYTYSCKKVSLNDSIKEYAEKKISKLERYFREEDPSAAVTFSVEKNHLCTVEITIRDGGTLFRAQTQAPDGDMRSAVDAAVGCIEDVYKRQVGMSTVPETIVAAHCGMQVLGFTLCTNMAAGVLDRPLSGEEVLEAAEAARPRFTSLVKACLERV